MVQSTPIMGVAHSSATDFIANCWGSGVSCHKLMAAQSVFSNTWLLRLALMLSDRSHQAL